VCRCYTIQPVTEDPKVDGANSQAPGKEATTPRGAGSRAGGWGAHPAVRMWQLLASCSSCVLRQPPPAVGFRVRAQQPSARTARGVGVAGWAFARAARKRQDKRVRARAGQTVARRGLPGPPFEGRPAAPADVHRFVVRPRSHTQSFLGSSPGLTSRVGFPVKSSVVRVGLSSAQTLRAPPEERQRARTRSCGRMGACARASRAPDGQQHTIAAVFRKRAWRGYPRGGGGDLGEVPRSRAI
jgi:hypothetical protein